MDNVQAAQQGYQQQGTAQGAAQQQQQQHHLQRQQQPHSQQHLNGAQQGRQQPNLQTLLSIQGGYSTAAPESRKRKAEDDYSALFSLLPDSKPSASGSAAPSIPQQVRLSPLRMTAGTLIRLLKLQRIPRMCKL